ncbi:MAG: cytochrome P450 [Actinomycetota bacterium]|nr:cytochrome P450 [Actinomycetota bacterium]
MSLLLSGQDPETGRGLSRDEVRDQVLVFLLAGHETTATAVTFALHLLGHHVDVQQRVRDELDDVLGGRTATSEDVPRLTTVRRMFNEAMRLHPPAYIGSQYAATDLELRDHRIRAGSLLPSVYHVHRDPAAWPEPVPRGYSRRHGADAVDPAPTPRVVPAAA